MEPLPRSPQAQHALRLGDSQLLLELGACQKAVRLANRAQLERALELLSSHDVDFVLQEAVPGGEECIVSYHAYVRPDGEVAAEFTGRKVRTYPRTYGMSTHLEITDDPETLQAGRRIVAQLGFSGVLKIDLKRHPLTGQLYLLEINPRLSLWCHPGALAGVDLPGIIYDELVYGLRRRAGPARAGVRWMLLRSDLRALGQYREAGEATLASWAWQALTADVVEDLCWHDPVPGLVELYGVIGRRVWSRSNGRPASATGTGDRVGLA